MLRLIVVPCILAPVPLAAVRLSAGARDGCVAELCRMLRPRRNDGGGAATVHGAAKRRASGSSFAACGELGAELETLSRQGPNSHGENQPPQPRANPQTGSPPDSPPGEASRKPSATRHAGAMRPTYAARGRSGCAGRRDFTVRHAQWMGGSDVPAAGADCGDLHGVAENPARTEDPLGATEQHSQQAPPPKDACARAETRGQQAPVPLNQVDQVLPTPMAEALHTSRHAGEVLHTSKNDGDAVLHTSKNACKSPAYNQLLYTPLAHPKTQGAAAAPAAETNRDETFSVPVPAMLLNGTTGLAALKARRARELVEKAWRQVSENDDGAVQRGKQEPAATGYGPPPGGWRHREGPHRYDFHGIDMQTGEMPKYCSQTGELIRRHG